jgi:hypothetical protein
MGLSFLLENLSDLTPENGHFVGHDIPNDVVINPKVVMNQFVSHARYGPPFHLRVALSDLGRDFLRRLADDLDASHKSPLKVLIARKGFFG